MTAAAHPSAGQVADEAQVAAQHTQEQLERLTLEGGEKVLPLPPPPRDISGAQVHKEKNYHLTVSNTNGYLAHIVLDATFDGVPPEALFSVFTWPDNSSLFRDVKRVGDRKVVSNKPGLRVVHIQQIGELRVLWIHRTFTTYLTVMEDSRDDSCLRIQFDLQKSDVLSKFSGNWVITPIKDASGNVTGCRGVLEQDILPVGIPAFMHRLPVLGGLLRGMTARSIKRIMEDLNTAMPKIAKELAAGKSIQRVMTEMCGAAELEPGHANGQVKSFQIADVGDEDEDEGAEAKAGDEADEQLLAANLDVLDDRVQLHIIPNAGAGQTDAK